MSKLRKSIQLYVIVLAFKAAVQSPFCFVYRTKWVQLNRHTFKRDSAVIFEISDMMKAVIISNIYLVNAHNVVFKGKTFDLSTYKKHFRAHILTPTCPHTDIYLLYHQLPLKVPLHPRISRVLPHHITVILPFYVL